MEEEKPDHIVFWCRKVRHSGEKMMGVRESRLRWDSLGVLAARRWVRMEDTGRVDGQLSKEWI